MVGSGIAEALHSDACFENYERDAFVGTALLSIYGKLGRMSETEYVFSELSSRDVVAWTAIISVFVEQEQGGKALQLYAQTESDGISPNHLTCIAGLQACSIFAAKQDVSIDTKRSLKAISLDIGHSLHLDACLRGFTCDIRVMTAILCMYGECGSITESELVFNTEGIHGRDTVLWNAMLSIYVAEGKGERALGLYIDMVKQNVIMDDVTLACMLQACGETGNIESCKKLHFVVISSCLEHLNCVGAALIHAYRSPGRMRDARECLDEIAYPDIVSWTSYAPSYPEQLDFEKSLEEMVSENHKLDDFILSLILACCNHGGLVEEGVKYFILMNSEYGITRSLQHIGIMIDLFGRAGDFRRVHSILARMQNQVDMATCVNLLGACHIHNNVEMAEQVFSLVTSMHQRDSRV
jgi:pentatricopeptide repeat protein